MTSMHGDPKSGPPRITRAGLMLGVKLKDSADARTFVAHARDNHQLLTVSAGENVVRILPPLIIGEGDVAEFTERLSAAARTFVGPADD